MAADLRYKLIFTVPHAHLAACKGPIFATGAGTYPGGKYTNVSFDTPGTGYFTPTQQANPAVGVAGKSEKVDEMRVEVLCVGRNTMLAAVQALKRFFAPSPISACYFEYPSNEYLSAHPYEQVAYEVYRLEDV
ncbi:hypothetical protein MMC20_006085 [Loxospora ochrophaea]|nr:hypothetical protein [Loxospora ochrophaea]